MNERDTTQFVWIISNQEWPRAFLYAELQERGYEVSGFTEVAQALAALGNKRTPKPDLILLELREQELKRIELDNLAHRAVRVIALGGATEFNQGLVRNFPWDAMMRRPFTISNVCELVEKLVPR